MAETDLIRRKDAIDTLNDCAELLRRVLDDMDVVGIEREKYSWGLELIESYIKDVEEMPSAQPEVVCQKCIFCGFPGFKQFQMTPPEREKGKWINKKPRWIGSLSMTVQDAYECSNCGEAGVNWWKYCIYCGAPMEIEEWRKSIIERWRSENE